MTFPWETPVAEIIEPEPKYDPFLFVRLRIQHGKVIRSVGIRADDTDITGSIALDDGSKIVIAVWGVPTATEPYMTSADALKRIAEYVKQNGLTPV